MFRYNVYFNFRETYLKYTMIIYFYTRNRDFIVILRVDEKIRFYRTI